MCEDSGDTGEFDQQSDEFSGNEDAFIDAHDDYGFNTPSDFDHMGPEDYEPNPYDGTYSEE